MKTAIVRAILFVALFAATSVYAQTRHHREREPKETEHPAPAVSVDKRDTVVQASGAFSGHPYWLALAQCGGIYFKLNVLYTAVAVRARVVSPDPKVNSEYTEKLNDAIKMCFQEGMVDFTENLRQLVDRGDVDKAVALEVAPSPEQLKMALKGIKVATPGIL